MSSDWREIRDSPSTIWKDSGYVYFARNPLSNVIKIGTSARLGNRIRALSDAAGTKLVLEAVVPRGGRLLEQHFHKAFAHLAIGHEWFNLGPDLESLVEEVVSEHGLAEASWYRDLLTAGDRNWADNPRLMARISVTELERTIEDRVDGMVGVVDDFGNLLGVWWPASKG